MRTSPSVLCRGLAFPLLAAIACLPAFTAGLQATEQPAVTVLVGSTVTNSIPSNGNANNKVSLVITDLSANETVQVNRYMDPSGSGVLDTTQPLVQSFLVTDGVVTSFGTGGNAVTDPRIPGDTDTISGQITTKFSISSQSFAGQAAGSYVFEIVSPKGNFAAGTVTASLTITQPAFTQSISGQVTASGSGSPVANATLFLFDLHSHDSGFICSVTTDATGHYSIQAAPGSYGIFASAPGLLGPGPFSLPALTSGVNLPGQNITLTPATRTITSVIESTDGFTVLPGIQFYVMSNTAGLISFAYSDVNGNVVIPVTAATDWNYSVDENSLDSIGFLPLQNNSGNADTTAGNLTFTAVQFGQFTPANALIFGTLKDSLGNPIAGIDVNDSDQSGTFNDDFLTNSNGSFFLLAAGPENWQLQTDNNALAALGLIAPDNVNLAVVANTAVPVTLTASAATTFFTGTVTENGSPLAGVILDAQPQNGGNNIRATTGGDGSFSLGVSAGTWNISLDGQSATQSSLVGPQLTETIAANQTISGIAYHVLPASATLSGTVKDANGNPLSSNFSVFANATISSQFYDIFLNLDNNGNYGLPLINGVWTIGVSGQNGTLSNYLPVTVTISGANQKLDLTPIAPSATFSGTVANNGTPLSGVVVDAQLQGNNNGNSLEFQATTNGDGAFFLGVTSGSWNIFLDSNSANNLVVPQLSETISTGQTISNLSYPVLTATANVSGTVKDANGSPLPSSDNVSASANLNGLPYNVFANVNAGTYSLPLVNGVWSLSVGGPNGAPAGFKSTTVTVSNNQGQTVNLSPFVATSSFSGTVTKGGSPLAGVIVDASPQGGGPNFQATTDNNGNFSLGVSPGTFNLQVDSSSVQQANIVTPGDLSETIAANQTLSGISIQVLAATATVSGTVKDAGGNLLSSSFNVDATATISNVFYNVDLNLQNGTYSLPLVSGVWELNVYGPGGPDISIPQTTVTVSNGQNLTVNLAPPTPTATFSGTVKNNGSPLAGITVFASSQNGGGNNSNSTTFQAATDSGGNFSLGVLSGSWNISLDNTAVAQQNLVASSLNNESIANGQTLSGLALQVLTATGTITGTISDYNSNPVTNDFVNVNATATVNGVAYVSNVSTGSNSTYSLPVINGSWVVFPSGGGLNFNGQTVNVTGSATLNFAASVINSQPQSHSVIALQDTTFSIGTQTPGSGSLQWQVSTDGGNTFTNLSDDLTYTGSLTNQLTVSNVTTALNGAVYRCVVGFTVNSSPLSQNSNPATLTVNKATANVFLGSLTQAFTGGQCFATASTDQGNLTVNFTYNGSSTAPTVAGSYSVVATISDPNFTGSATGTLNILPDFAFYLSQFFNNSQLNNPAITGPAANPAGDGMPNLLKYALGLDPTQVDAAAGAPTVGQSGGGNLTLTYISPPGVTDVNYIVEVSSDLVTWNSGPSFTAVVSTTNLDSLHVRTVVRDLTPIVGNARRFIRLRVTPVLPP